MKLNRSLFLLLSMFCAWKGFSQPSCKEIDSLLCQNEFQQAKKLIFNTLRSAASLSDSFFYCAYPLLDTGTIPADSVSIFFTYWKKHTTDSVQINTLEGALFAKLYEQTANPAYILPAEFYLSFLSKKSGYFTPLSYHFFSEHFICQLSVNAQKKLPHQMLQVFNRQHLNSADKIPWKDAFFTFQKMLLTCDNISCTTADSICYTSLQTETMKLPQIKLLHALLLQKGCEKCSSFLATNKIIADAEPNFNSLFKQGELYSTQNVYSEALHYFAEAEKTARLPQQKSLCYMGIARILRTQANYPKAKDFAFFAAEADPENKECYNFLADLYRQAESVCSIEEPKERCALFLLISRMYAKAGDQSKSDFFYQKSDLKNVLANYTGNMIPKQKLTCFLNEEVELRK